MKTQTIKSKRPPRVPRRRALPAIQSSDLTDRERLDAIHQHAVASGVIDASERTRWNFFAAASQARMKGDDPVRLFCWIVNKGAWHVLTDAADDGARALLKPRRLTRERDENKPLPDAVRLGDVLAVAIERLIDGPSK